LDSKGHDQIRHELIAKKGRSAPLPKNYPYKKRMARPNYEIRKQELQIELLKVQNWVKDTGQRILCIFEGRDAAGTLHRSDQPWINIKTIFICSLFVSFY